MSTNVFSRQDVFPLLSADAESFLQAILGGDQREARRIAMRALDFGLAHVYQHVVQAAMDQVGRLWQDGRICVAQEHLATAVAESTVASLYPEIAWPLGGALAIVSCAEGERHQFGARMVADLLALDGWRTAFLGADVPTREVVNLARDRNPLLVALSLSLPDRLSGVRPAIEALRAAAPGVRVLVGGRALAALPDPTVLGADAHAASAAGAVQIARGFRP